MDDKNNLFKEFQSVLKKPIMIEDIDQYLSDWRGVFKGKVRFVAFPSTTEEVSKIIKDLENGKSSDIPIKVVKNITLL